MATVKLILRRVRTLLWTAFSIVVILAAVLAGAGRLLMPYSAHYQPQLEQWLSREFGQPVALDSFEGEWSGFGPRLTLRGLRLLPGDPDGGAAAEPVAVIESAALDIRPLNALLPGRALYNFRVIGAHFELVRDAAGEYRLSGFGVSRRGGAETSALGDLARVGEVVLEDSSLDYVDAGHGIRLGMADIRGRLSLQGGRLAARVAAQMHDRRSGLRYGDVEATLSLTLDEQQRMQSATWDARTRRLMLAAFQGRVPANPFLPLTGWLDCELWGSWSREAGHEVRGVTDLRDVLLSNEVQDLHLEQLDYRFRWRFGGVTDWRLDVADFFFDDGVASWTVPRLAMARDTARDLGLWIGADRLPLAMPVKLTRDVMSVYGVPWPEWVPNTVAGTASDLDLVLGADWRVRRLDADIAGAAVADWAPRPDVSGLDGRIDLGADGGTVRLAGERLNLDWPQMFREPLAFAVPGCAAEIDWSGALQVTLRDCRVENEDLAAAGDVVVRANGGGPALDLNVVVERGRVAALDPYWPQGVMPSNTVDWLRRGLVDGELESGRVLIFGDMDDWPFRAGEGRFEAVGRLRGLEVEYQEGWPAARGARATARFIGASMEIEGEADDVHGTAVRDIRVAIADMAQPALEVAWAADADLPGLLGFLQDSPLRAQADTDLSAFEFAGPASTKGSLWLPLGETPGELRVDGAVTLRDGRFTDPERGVTIDGIGGVVNYSENGFHGEGLDARFRGEAARLDLHADARAEEKFRAGFSGEFDVASLLAALPGAAAGLRERARGRSDWRAALTIAPGALAGVQDVTLVLESMLGGVTLDLPAPLDKPAVERWPFRFTLPLGGAERPLDVEFTDRAALRLDLSGPGNALRRALLRFDGGLDDLPPPGVLRLAGEAARLDLDGWIGTVVDEIAGGATGAGLQLETAGLGARELWFLDRPFDDVGIDLALAAPEVRIVFSSADLDGSVRYRYEPTGAGTLTAEFERLALGDPRSAGVRMDTDPADLPVVHLYARSFRYGALELGETRIEAYPTAAGFQFEKVDAASPGLSVQASGLWTLAEDGHRSDFSIHLVSESLGDFLRTMDISSAVQGGQTVVDFDAWWAGTPAEFALPRLNGQVDFSVVQGNISNASAGPGRLLGLVSVQALPKRLALDFRDVFDSGFSFDEATGTFTLENGIAETGDTRLKSSSATIDISGRTDLVERRYDQLMTIRPGVGNTLPIIGALAAGPGGAAAGLALQGLLHEQLSQATQVRYSITGSWDEPLIEPVEVERAGG